jgi:hypothetical protein
MFGGRCKEFPKQHLLLSGLLLMFTLTVAPAWGLEPYSLDTAAPKASADLPRSLVDHLDAAGLLVFTYSNGLRMPVCEIFWAKTLTVEDVSSGSSKLSYRDLKRGALVGVIHFLPEATEEFREDVHDQKLKPGYYTMRYAVTSDGDIPDSVLLSPVRVDRDPERVLTADQLLRLSLKASGTGHPAIMSMVPIENGIKDSPSVRMDDHGTCIVQANLQVKGRGGAAKELALAMIVVNPLPDDGGS